MAFQTILTVGTPVAGKGWIKEDVGKVLSFWGECGIMEKIEQFDE